MEQNEIDAYGRLIAKSAMTQETKHTPAPMQQVIADMGKIDYHPYSPDDGHYDSGYDYEQVGQLMSKHFHAIRLACNVHVGLTTALEYGMEQANLVFQMNEAACRQALQNIFNVNKAALAKARGEA